LLYPPRCIGCGELVETDFGLCGTCWKDTPFIGGLVCNCCGVPLPGDGQDSDVMCDDCMAVSRPWKQGRAALLYQGTARKLVLRLKHADRHDIVRPAVTWMVRAARHLPLHDALVAPVPLHWTRYLRRRYNQSALLAQGLAQALTLEYCPDLLLRPKATRSLEGASRDERFAHLQGAIIPNPRHAALVRGRCVLLVDDVMTSGATFAAATQACLQSQAGDVHVIALARVAKRT
jgi:predicted amidophosphoribosyltransferase